MTDVDRPALITQLVGEYIDTDPALTGPGLEPWHSHIRDGYVRAVTAVLTDQPESGAEFTDQVRVAFVGLCGAVEEEAEFDANVDGYLDRHGIPRGAHNQAAMQERLEGDRRYWSARLYSLRPFPKVVGL